MLKASIASALALAAAVSVSGCGGKSDESAKTAAPAASTATPEPGAQPTVPMNHPPAAPGATVDLSGIGKAANGKTVAELYAGKDALANTTVTVRGKVVKVSHGIMNRDWLHVRDGSGAERSNDLAVTTTSTPPAKVGDIVVVTGKLGIDKDLGMGYLYPVIIEDAEVKIEPAGST